ncbi:hemerythrin domain-containing protein [Aquabacterium humicola]|uniref:hemerythrin domain-containing protein n=1 Tax=Aquabacterium humicola TaxID=3237377 RepID=UPI00254287E2|nr:hemerythrin domain-containing protein [Rubrivivax pictus]
MPALTWTETLRLQQPQMDRTHEEFVALLADVRTRLGPPPVADAPADTLPADATAAVATAAVAAFERLLAHTVEHFAQEDRWMQATGFAPENCHSRQHALVLQVMHEALRLARDEGRGEAMAILVDELGTWFPQHASMMDAGLAQQMVALGFDPETGTCRQPLPEAAIRHCGGGGCGG